MVQLGIRLGDAYKYLSQIALLIVKEDDYDYSGSEYLKIYPIIGRRYAQLDNYYDDQFPDGSNMELLKWLNS